METLLAGLRAAAEPTRLRILAMCAHAELTVTELTQILGQSQPRVSRHLKLMCEAGLLERHREGTWAFYRVADRGSCAALARTLVNLVPDTDARLMLDLTRLEAIKQARSRAAADYFRANAERWDEIRSLHVPEDEVEQSIVAMRPGDACRDILDIGTGTGRILEVLAPFCERGLGIDYSHEMLRVARANLEHAGIGNCQIRHGDMYGLAVPGSSFDFAVLHQVLHFAEEPAAVIREAARVLRPGGRLVIVDFESHEQEYLRRDHQHRWLGFDAGELDTWCRAAGLEIGEVRRLAGDPLTVLVCRADRAAQGLHRLLGVSHSVEGV